MKCQVAPLRDAFTTFRGGNNSPIFFPKEVGTPDGDTTNSLNSVSVYVVSICVGVTA
jgi:hypothetical protein